MISFCLLRSGFQRAIYHAFNFFLLLAFFGAFEMIVHVKQWLMLLQRYFHVPEILVGLLFSSHPTSELQFWETKFQDFAIFLEYLLWQHSRKLTPAKMFNILVAKVYSYIKSFYLQKLQIIIHVFISTFLINFLSLYSPKASNYNIYTFLLVPFKLIFYSSTP